MIASQTLILASALSSLPNTAWWVQLLAGLGLLAGGLGLRRIAQVEQSSLSWALYLAVDVMVIGGTITVLYAVL